MKNKEKYKLNELEFKKKRFSRDYDLSYITEVYLKGNLIAKFNGGALSDIMAWLESEANESN